MFLAEIGLDKARLIFIRDNLKFEGLLEFLGEGRGCGVAIMWKKDVDFSVDTYSLNHIYAIINKGKESLYFLGHIKETEIKILIALVMCWGF